MKVIILFCFLIFFNLAKGQEKIDTTYNVNGRNIRLKSTDLGDYQMQLKKVTSDYEIVFDTLTDSNAIFGFDLVQFDDDNYPDLLAMYLGNNPYYILYLFDPIDDIFKKIEEYHNFPDSKRLKNQPKYYYSYHRAGCADRNWVSDFFKLANFKIQQLGHISGQGCEALSEDDPPQQIEIFKVTSVGDIELMETLNYTQNINRSFDKWDFIEKYWNENARKFQ